ncbi:MAG: ABC transporter ATP-binding protein [Clostridiales bacterium]|nr:ABC transporter ATP-binding protein [Clostridiales bacterium]
MKELMKMEGVSLTYHTKTSETEALKDLNFSLFEGEFVAIVGPSGCGKTSVLSVIAGLLTPTEGEISFPLKGESKNYIGYMLQKDELFPWRTIWKNVILPLEIKGAKTQENLSYVTELLKKYGLYDFKSFFPSQLSGGMKQRAALIRTLSLRPELLLLDEPFSALDYQTRLSVCDDVYGIIKSENLAALLVTHDIGEAISTADRIIVLSGRPARIKNVYTLDQPQNLSPLQRRETPQNKRFFDLIWKELHEG